MSTDPYSGIDKAYLLAELKATALTEQVRKAQEAQGLSRHRCPFPEHPDINGSFSVTDGKGWLCNGCNHYGEDVVSFRSQLDDSTLDEAIAALAREYNIPRPTPARKPAKETPIIAPRNAQELLDHLLALPDHQVLSESLRKALMSEEGAPGRAYLEGRGISEALWVHHGLGYVVPGSRPGLPLGPAWEGMITFPIRAGEHVINFQGRRITGPDKLNCKGLEVWPFNMNALLLGSERSRVYVCEGPVSALALEEMGYQPAVALLGQEIGRDLWPLFSQARRPVILALDAKKGETEEVLAERQSVTVERFRRLGFWRYLQPDTSVNLRYGYQMDPAEVWLASGFEYAAPDALETVAPIAREKAAYVDVPPGPPDDEVAPTLARAVAKNTRGLTLTLRHEDGPELGYYLDFTRQDGRAFTIGPPTNPTGEQVEVLGIHARRDPTPLSENVYVQGDLETSLALMAAIKKLRRRLQLAVADGLDPALLEDLTKRQRPRSLSDEVRVPRTIAEYMTYPRRHRNTPVASMEVVSPEGGRRMTLRPVLDRQLELEIPEQYAPLIPSDTKALLGLFRLFVGSPMRIDTTFTEVAEAMGITTLEGGHSHDLLWEQLNRLKTWWYWDADSESEWTFNFIGGLKRYPKTGRLIIDKSLAVHEALNGSLGKDYMVANWSKLEGLTPQALGLYVAYCLRSDPHYWKLENIAAAVSTNKKSSRAEAEAEKALQELESVGIHVREPDSPKGTRVKVLAAPDYNGPWPFWWDKGPR